MDTETRHKHLKRTTPLGLVATLLLATGCGTTPTQLGLPAGLNLFSGGQVPVSDDPALGFTVLLSGIEGGTGSMEAVRQAMRDGGVPGDIHIHQWGEPGDIVTNSSDKEHNFRAAAEVVRLLEEFHSLFPNAPMQLVGYSGGGGIAVLAADSLPPELRLARLVLVQSAVNSEYDLTTVLARVDEMVNLYSPVDVFFMGVGTQYFGNVAGPAGNAAGRTGFETEKSVQNEKELGKLKQIEWSPEMTLSGHFGGHLEILGYEWNRVYVAPHLK